MANLTENRVNTVISAADLATIMAAILSVESKMPIKGLTDEEREALTGIDVENKIFVEDVINEMSSNAHTGIFPAFININAMKTDLSLFEQMDSIISALENATQKARDIRNLAGSEAFAVANVVYGIYETAARVGIPGAKQSYMKLKERYNKSGRKPAEVLPPNPPDKEE